jgi:hypothetical protein
MGIRLGTASSQSPTTGLVRLVVYDLCAAPTVWAVRLQAITPVCPVQWNAIWGAWRLLSQ